MRLRTGWVRAGAYAAAGVVLALVFASYLAPGMVTTLATQVWALCF